VVAPDAISDFAERFRDSATRSKVSA